MPRNKLQEGEGMTRPPSFNSPTPSRASRFSSMIKEESDMTTFNTANVQELHDLCKDCCDKCNEHGLTDAADQCEALRTKCETASQALAKNQMMGFDWFSFALQAFQLIQQIINNLPKPTPKPVPPTPSVTPTQ